MPALRNPRHERFIREFMKSGVAARAYLAAGYRASSRNVLDSHASRLASNGKVKARIAELRRQMTQKTKISLENLMSELAADRDLARSLGQPSAAIQATTMQAKLAGLLVDRKETGTPGEFASLTAAQILERVRADHGDLVADALAKAFSVSTGESPTESVN